MNRSLSDENLTKRVLHALGIFGGVQSVTVIFSVIRVKLIAIWLGSDGMGLFGIFNSAMELVASATQLSLRSSAVRDISSAEKGAKLDRIVFVVLRLAWLLGLAGAAVMLAAAPLLSRYTFGNDDFTWHYRLLSIAVFLLSLQNGFSAVMQGMERFGLLARTQLWGAVGGFAISVPMFYFWGIDSVIPSIIVYVAVPAAVAFIYRVKMKAPEPKPSWRSTLKDGSGLLKLGFYMTVSSFASLAASYVFIAWLNEESSTETVGLFNAGFTLVNRYVGFVLGAVATEYYPRLSRIFGDRLETDRHVSTQIEVGMKVLLPMALVFIAADRWIVELLYSSEFELIVPFVNWAMIGTLFRMVSWCMAFVILARGDGKIYVVTEVLGSIVYLAANIFAFSRWGIRGMGYAYCLWYIIYTLIVGVVYYVRYGNRLSAGAVVLTVSGIAVSLLGLWLSDFVGRWTTAVMAVVVGVPAVLSLRRSS